MGMTIEDIKHCLKVMVDCEVCEECKFYPNCDHMTQDDMTELTIRDLETLEQEPRWIPVSERLPDTDDEVLCWYEYYHWSQEKVLPEYGLGRYLRETSAWFGEVANGKDARVIAWMPLPKNYEEVEK